MIEKDVTKGGKPFQSKLAPYEAEVKELKANGASVRAIADETPKLMRDWIKAFNSLFGDIKDEDSALEAYLFAHVSFVRIHPFFDGNGRIARLLANLPVLCAGFPPIVVPSEARLDYISELWDYQRAVGVISLASRELLPEPSRLDKFRRLVKDWWQTTLDLVAEAKRK